MATSELQEYTGQRLRKLFGKYGVVENVRPSWLISSRGERLELDFFIDKLSVAVEVQGRQHVEFTPFFHVVEYNFSEQLRRDREKKDMCSRLGVHLFYVYTKSDVGIILYEVHTQVRARLDTKKSTWTDDDGRGQSIFHHTRSAKQRTVAILTQLKRYEKKLRKYTPVERQAYFDKVIDRLEYSLNATAGTVPSENSKRKMRQKIRLVTYCKDRCYAIASGKQDDIIRKGEVIARLPHPPTW